MMLSMPPLDIPTFILLGVCVLGLLAAVIGTTIDKRRPVRETLLVVAMLEAAMLLLMFGRRNGEWIMGSTALLILVGQMTWRRANQNMADYMSKHKPAGPVP